MEPLPDQILTGEASCEAYCNTSSGSASIRLWRLHNIAACKRISLPFAPQLRTTTACFRLAWQGHGVQALKTRVAQLQAAARERGDREAASEHEVARLRKANQVLEAHLDMLRSGLDSEQAPAAQVRAQRG